MGISLSQGHYLHTEPHKHRMKAHIYALNGIRTHDTSVQESEGSLCLRMRAHCVQLSAHKCRTEITKK
jgi:hypothetical protein